MKRWLAFLVVVAAGFGIWKWYSNSDGGPVQFTTVAVGRGPLTQAVTATGTLNPVINVTVGSQISGNIQKLFADYNSPVTANQVVAQLDPSVSKAQVEQAKANLLQAQASLQQAKAGVANSRAGVSDAQARAQGASSTAQNNLSTCESPGLFRDRGFRRNILADEPYGVSEPI